MATHMKSIGCIGLIAAALVGCSRMEGLVMQESVQPLIIDQHVAGDDLKMAEPVAVVNSREELDALGHEGLSALSIDFGSQSLLVLTLGQKPTTGWWTRIDAVQLDGSELYFQGVASAPGQAQDVSPTVTYPYAAAVIPKVGDVLLRPEIESVEGQVPHVR